MTTFCGIDLGTTNSAIATFDGREVRLYKSPEMNDVTPSVLYFDKRGNRYVGTRAHQSAMRNPENAAMLFKREMGRATRFRIDSLDRELTPEECSAQLLSTLYSYLDEGIRSDPSTGTVITVPAAFNQMQRAATSEAAQMAGIPRVAIMQEPVAAVMSVMRRGLRNATFVIFDLGGGTLDVALAQSTDGRVSLLEHGGIQMCGGRDFDRALLQHEVVRYLKTNYRLPEDFATRKEYRTLVRAATWAAERAKIELSLRENSAISLTEGDLGIRDLDGQDIYIDIPITRAVLNDLMAPKLHEAVEETRRAIRNAGFESQHLDFLVFVGGPTQYKPLRDLVEAELGIRGFTDVNPMTAVAEGAAIFAESVDWSAGRGATKGTAVSSRKAEELKIAFPERTPDERATVRLERADATPGTLQVELTGRDDGWTSGRVTLTSRVTIETGPLRVGENRYGVTVYSEIGEKLPIRLDDLVIVRTLATVEAIPASSSIGIEVIGGAEGRSTVLDYLVRKGDALEKRGRKLFRAAEPIRAGERKELVFKIWEGEIETPVSDNRFIGVLRISGTDFEFGEISVGAEIYCAYKVEVSGALSMEVEIPSIGGTFGRGQNFYSRGEGAISSDSVRVDTDRTLEQLRELSESTADPSLPQVEQKVRELATRASASADAEDIGEVAEAVQAARSVMATVRKTHQQQLRRRALQEVIDAFHANTLADARQDEADKFARLAQTAERESRDPGGSFDILLGQLWGLYRDILLRNDQYIVRLFHAFAAAVDSAMDRQKHQALVQLGEAALARRDMRNVRAVCSQLYDLQIRPPSREDEGMSSNIRRG